MPGLREVPAQRAGGLRSTTRVRESCTASTSLGCRRRPRCGAHHTARLPRQASERLRRITAFHTPNAVHESLGRDFDAACAKLLEIRANIRCSCSSRGVRDRLRAPPEAAIIGGPLPWYCWGETGWPVPLALGGAAGSSHRWVTQSCFIGPVREASLLSQESPFRFRAALHRPARVPAAAADAVPNTQHARGAAYLHAGAQGMDLRVQWQPALGRFLAGANPGIQRGVQWAFNSDGGPNGRGWPSTTRCVTR